MNNLDLIPEKFNITKISSDQDLKHFIKLPLRDIREEFHLSALCYMADEDMYILGTWNSKKLLFFDANPENNFKKILEMETNHIFNISTIKYIDHLKLLLVGDCFSGLSCYR